MNLAQRTSTIETHFRIHHVDPQAPFITFTDGLWQHLEFDRLSKLLGWAAFRDPVASMVHLHGLTPDDQALFAAPSPLSICPERIASTTAHLSDGDLARYLHAVTGYAHAVWAVRSVADVEERHRLADNAFYDRDPIGWRMIIEVVWRVTLEGPRGPSGDTGT